MTNKCIEEINSEFIVSYVVRNKMGDRIKLPLDRAAKEIQCLDCGSSKGFYNPCWKAWACLEEKCLLLWLPANSSLRMGYKESKKD